MEHPLTAEQPTGITPIPPQGGIMTRSPQNSATRHPSVPKEIPDETLVEFRTIGARGHFQTPVREDQPYVTIEDGIRFLPGRAVILTLALNEEIMKASGMDTSLLDGGHLSFDNTVPEARLADRFRSVIRPATIRWTPPVTGEVRSCVVVWSYKYDRQTGKTSRRGKALPFGQALSEEEYLPAPDPKQPITTEILFYPAQRGEHVVPTASSHDGREIVLDSGFPMKEWGKPLHVMLIEDGSVIRAIPVPKTAEEAEAASMALENALMRAEPVDLQDDEMLYNGEKVNIYHILAPFEITTDSTKSAIKAARRAMANQYHPDKGAWKAVFGDKGPPAFMARSNGEVFNRFSEAFRRLEEVRNERREAEKTEATDSTESSEARDSTPAT